MFILGCTNDNSQQEVSPKPHAVKNMQIAAGDHSNFTEQWSNNPKNSLSQENKSDETNRSNKTEKIDVKGIYLNRTSLKEENIDEYIDFVKTSKLNAVVMDIKDDYGKLTYDSKLNMANELGIDANPAIEDLKSFISRLKDEGIYTIGRVVVFKDPYLAEKKPEYTIKRKDGSVWSSSAGIKWLDPHKKETWSYVTDISAEVADFGIDEIQYDYVRFPENAKKVNQEVAYDNPEGLEKADVIQQFLQYSNEQLQDKGVYISADVFGLVTSANDDMGIGQNWDKLAPELDYISPMTYPSHYAENTYGIGNPDAHPYEVMLNAMQDAKAKNEKLKQEGKSTAIIRPWIQDFDYKRSYSETDVRNQMKAIQDEGLSQFLIWNAQNVYTKEAFN